MPTSIEVVQLTTSFPVEDGTASGSFIRRLVDSLPPAVRPVVVAPGGTGASRPADPRLRPFRYAPHGWQRLAHRPGGIPVALAREPILYLLLPGFLLAMAWACLCALRTAGVIHAHWSVNGVIAGLVARLMGRAAVTTLWGEDVTRASRPGVFRALLWMCLLLNHRVVAVSEAMRRRVAADFPAFGAKLEYVPNGVSAELMQIGERRALQGEPLRLLYVGSLIPRKGVDIVLRALARCEDAHLTVVGDGDEAGSLRALARELGVASRVEFAGAVAPDAVAAHYARATAFVLASASEGMPSVVLEAMASGLPVVASDIDGVRELLEGGAGLTFAPGDADALAARLRQLADDSGLRHRLGAAARAAVRERGFCWDAIGTRYAQLYASLAPA